MLTRDTGKSATPGREKRPNGRSAGTRTRPLPRRRKGEPLHPVLMRLGDWIPESEARRLEPDAFVNHDHYIYGAPKQY